MAQAFQEDEDGESARTLAAAQMAPIFAAANSSVNYSLPHSLPHNMPPSSMSHISSNSSSNNSSNSSSMPITSFFAAANSTAENSEANHNMPVAITSMRELQQNYYHRNIPEGTVFIVWDTETTGLGRLDCVVQLAATFCTSDGTCLALYNRLWQLPAGCHIGSRARAIHGITEEDLYARGCEAKVELCRVSGWFKQATAAGIPIVAFNSRFDERMLVQTATAHNTALDLSAVKFSCLQVASNHHSPLKTAKGHHKGFKNSELFVHFFKKEPAVRLHDAAGDIAVTAACYVKAREKNWITG